MTLKNLMWLFFNTVNNDESDNCRIAVDKESDGQNESKDEEVNVIESVWKCSSCIVPGAAD